MLIFGAIFSGGNVQYELAVQNKDGSNISVAFINAVNSTNAFKVHMVNASENADTYIKSNRISGMLIVPARVWESGPAQLSPWSNTTFHSCSGQSHDDKYNEC